MTGFWTLISKELLEQRRTWRLVGAAGFFSAVALLIAVIPFIISLFTDIERDSEFARSLLEAYGGTTATLGALVAIVFGMGVLANERASGTAGMVLSKPVSVAAFVSARFAGMASSIYLGFAAGAIVMFILTTILISYYDAVTFAIYMSIIGFYLVFVSSMTFFWSGMFSRQMLAGGIALVLFIIQLPLTAIPKTARLLARKPCTLGLRTLAAFGEAGGSAMLGRPSPLPWGASSCSPSALGRSLGGRSFRLLRGVRARAVLPMMVMEIRSIGTAGIDT